MEAYLKGGPRKITPFFVPRSIINMISGNLSIMFGIKGPNIACGDRVHHGVLIASGWQRRLIAYRVTPM